MLGALEEAVLAILKMQDSVRRHAVMVSEAVGKDQSELAVQALEAWGCAEIIKETASMIADGKFGTGKVPTWHTRIHRPTSPPPPHLSTHISTPTPPPPHTQTSAHLPPHPHLHTLASDTRVTGEETPGVHR